MNITEFNKNLDQLHGLCERYAKNKNNWYLEKKVYALWDAVRAKFPTEFKKIENEIPIRQIKIKRGGTCYINRIGTLSDDEKTAFFQRFKTPEIDLYSIDLNLVDIEKNSIEEFCYFESHRKSRQWTTKQLVDVYRISIAFKDKELQEHCLKKGHLQIEIKEKTHFSEKFLNHIERLNSLYLKYFTGGSLEFGVTQDERTKHIFSIWQYIQQEFPEECKKIDAKCQVIRIKRSPSDKRDYFINRMIGNEKKTVFDIGGFKNTDFILEDFNLQHVDDYVLFEFCDYLNTGKKPTLFFGSTHKLIQLFDLADAFSDDRVKDLCLEEGYFEIVESKKGMPGFLITTLGSNFLFESKEENFKLWNDDFKLGKDDSLKKHRYPIVAMDCDFESPEQLTKLIREYPELERLKIKMLVKEGSLQSLAKIDIPIRFELDLRHSDGLKFGDLRSLAKFKYLTSLNLARCGSILEGDLEEVVVKEMKPLLERLESLDLSWNKDIASSLVHLVPSLTKLTSINLASTDIEDKHLLVLSIFLNNLDFLDLSSIKDLSSAGIKAMIKAQKHPFYLKLGMTNLGDEGLIKIGEDLLKLKGLDLVSGRITATGIKQIAPHLTNLLSLKLCLYQSMDDKCFSDIVGYLGKLECLDISGTVLQFSGFKMIANELKELRSLNASYTNLTADDLEILCESLPNLTSIDITGCSHVIPEKTETIMQTRPNIKIINQKGMF